MWGSQSPRSPLKGETRKTREHGRTCHKKGNAYEYAKHPDKCAHDFEEDHHSSVPNGLCWTACCECFRNQSSIGVRCGNQSIASGRGKWDRTEARSWFVVEPFFSRSTETIPARLISSPAQGATVSGRTRTGTADGASPRSFFPIVWMFGLTVRSFICKITSS